jgi:hypothetical protein
MKAMGQESMFSAAGRDKLSARVIEWAKTDARITAAARVGSLSFGGGDRWSDLDLTFAVKETVPLSALLEDWTRRLVEEFQAVHLFDLPSGPSIYRVFLLPGCLQFDLSFTPAAHFGATGPKFELLFGEAVERDFVQPAPARELFGYAVHHAVRARFCIERGKAWQAEYWISSLRDYALNLACRRLGLPAAHGRGYDQLPAEILKKFEPALVRSLDRQELMRALACAIEGLLNESTEVPQLAAQVAAQLRQLSLPFPREPG